jgi:hypothetical protein
MDPTRRLGILLHVGYANCARETVGRKKCYLSGPDYIVHTWG